MKKTYLIISALFSIATSSFAQLDSIRNANFDRWTSGEPDMWGTSNSLNPSFAGGVTQATGGDILGSNTIVLTTKTIPGIGAKAGVAVSNGTVALAGSKVAIGGGFPFRQHIVAVTGISKYISAGGTDAPSVSVVLTKWNGTKRDTIGVGQDAPSSSTYTPFSVPIFYFGGAVAPDTAIIILTSSGQTGAVAGSQFFVDSLGFDYGCTLDPKIISTGNKMRYLPGPKDTLKLVAGASYSRTWTIYIPKNSTVSGISGTLDSAKISAAQIKVSGSSAGGIGNYSITTNWPNNMIGSNTIACVTISGTLPACPLSSTDSLTITPLVWGSAAGVGNFSAYPSPITTTTIFKIGTGASDKPVVNSPVNYFQDSTAIPLTAAGTSLLWYTVATGGTGSSAAPTPSTATVGQTDYYVSQTVNTCESSRAKITVNVLAATAPPKVSTPISFCQNSSALTLTAVGSSLLWYTSATGGTGSASAPTPSTATIGSTNYYVSQTKNANESTRALIRVDITTTTVVPAVTSPVTYCQNSAAVPLIAVGTNLLWYSAATGGTGSSSTPTPSTVSGSSYYVSQNTCGEGPRAKIDVLINPIPVLSVNSPKICAPGDMVTLTAHGANSYLWSTSATTDSITVTPTGTTSYTVTGTTAFCSSATLSTVTLDVCTGIEEIKHLQKAKIFPNPNNGAFTISIENAMFKGLNVSISNVIGETVFSATYVNTTISFKKEITLNSLTKGIYYIRLETEEDVKIEKLIIE
jgi:Secretion system C-terminal sorting domain/Ig-like domain CHU_C associated